MVDDMKGSGSARDSMTSPHDDDVILHQAFMAEPDVSNWRGCNNKNVEHYFPNSTVVFYIIKILSLGYIF